MNLNSRPSLLMSGLVKSDLWSNYQTMPGLKGVSTNRNAYKYFQRDTTITAIPGESRYKFMQQNPTYLAGMLSGRLGDTTDDSTDIGNLIKQGILAWNTQTITQANAQRIANGLAPLDASAYAPTVNMALSSSSIMMLALAGVAVFYLAKK